VRGSDGAAEFAGIPPRKEDGMTESHSATSHGSALAERLAEEMAARWRRGERPLAEEYLARHPDLRADPEAAIDLIHEEICLREEHGLPAPSSEILGRFPQWRTELEILLGCHRLLEPAAPAPRFPAVGETLGDFRLLAELGRGARGRVFLAVQAPLADRPVVLKVTPCGGREHLILARLQHTYIVPLYAVQDDAPHNLRLLCMPYFGGATLARLLDAVRDRSPARRSGRDLLTALDAAQAELPLALPARGGARQFLAQASYPQAVCWLAACLAEALHYAHERGLVHLDLKPSNILLAADGQPMLLDFHVAQGPLYPDRPPPERLGGSPAYMSPEQLAALDAVRAGRPVPIAVDGRSDVYSLGVVLYEALAGTRPARPPVALHRRNHAVSVGLSDVVGKCLAPDPAERYADAAALAGDLRRHLADLPLRGVANRSLGERWGKWRRRQPFALALAAMFVAVLTVLAVALVYLAREVEDVKAALAEGQAQLDKGLPAEAARTFRRGLLRAGDWPVARELARELSLGLGAADRALAADARRRVAEELHAVADQLRGEYGADWRSVEEQRDLEAVCRVLWGRREEITHHLDRDVEPNRNRQIHDDLLDLALLWADLRVRLARRSQVAAAHREALEILAEAEALHGPSPVLDHQRQRHALAGGDPAAAAEAGRRAAARAPRTAWEHCALGRALLRTATKVEPVPGAWPGLVRQCSLALAAAELQRAVDLEPQSLWPYFYRGACALRLGRYEEAVTAFTACTALAPGLATAFHNRALAEAALGRTDRAVRDCEEALRIAPGHPEARALRDRLQTGRGRLRQLRRRIRRPTTSSGGGGAAPAE
jgi:serine/threonine protein kinase